LTEPCADYLVAGFCDDEPANSRRPSGKVMLVALAVLDPFRAWKPSMTIIVPATRSSFRHPRR
jgi:hypothetical protein